MPGNALTLEDFQMGQSHISRREQDLKEFLTRADQLYTGEQHVRLMRGVSAFRSKLDLWILSAGYGLIRNDRRIAPYECTFATMGVKEIRSWGEALDVPKDFRSAVAQPYDLALILLGDKYLQACQLATDVQFGGPTVLFCGQGPARRIPRLPNLRVVTLSNPEAKRFSCGLVGLKGELSHRILQKVASEPDYLVHLPDPAFDILASLDAVPLGSATSARKESSPGAVPREKCRPNPAVDHVIQLPKSWWDRPHRQKLRYFIPEWDDLVDPDYDFLNDEHSCGTGDWSNNVYAHQMYPEPNYDGLLMSRAVAEKSKKKKERINALGVHRFLRVPREFPIMGDCGAFDYIMQEKPPYTTEDVLDYYTRLDFDYGVSVDHLIVSATGHQKKFRYELTIHNAEDFFKQHREAGLKWEPIGAVQGWDAETYAKAAAQYVKMGYRYIALGGLVRSNSRDILRIIRAVRQVVPKTIQIHLFGVARPNALRPFQEAGIDSVDSASYLRQAWMRINQSYASFTGPYASLRIPEAGKSFRAKRMQDHASLSEEKILKLEGNALRCVRLLAGNKCSVDDCLEALLEYDQFVTAERVDLESTYRRTLTDRPWEKCDCAICKKCGVETIIFRGSNRNRRRGFHNTYIFYRLFQKILRGESITCLGDSDDAKSSQLRFSALLSCHRADQNQPPMGDPERATLG